VVVLSVWGVEPYSVLETQTQAVLVKCFWRLEGKGVVLGEGR
jgi:hypothetical protein